MPERQDYVQRLVEELTHLLAEVVRFRTAGSHEAALLTLLHGQERLFVRPAQEFMALPVGQQVHLLTVDESPPAARDKCLAYVALLTEVGRTYEAKGQPAPAAGAYHVALHVALLTALELPAAPDLPARIDALRASISAGSSTPEVQELLARYDARPAGR